MSSGNGGHFASASMCWAEVHKISSLTMSEIITLGQYNNLDKAEISLRKYGICIWRIIRELYG